MTDNELLKLARDIIVVSDPSGLADQPRWYDAKIQFLTEYLKRSRQKPTWKFYGLTEGVLHDD